MSILLDQLTKRYEGHPVVNHVSLEIADGEFFVLIGPSGSGKSTVLRMIAGLNTVDEGRILLHGRDVTYAPPQQRGVGFVFQHYALFKHMSVADNIEFALRVRKVSAAERRRRRDELLELVGLAGLGGRMPNQLSGGQQQRVALARAVAHRPEVLLLDEPFGALDAKIRVDLRRALRAIQTELNITTIFVTHDQEEAFELADRLGVMNFGRLLEVGRPAELYQRPQTEFVATFLGTANLLVGEQAATGVNVGPLHFPLKTDLTVTDSHRVQVLFRPEDVVLGPTPEALNAVVLGRGEVEQGTFVGAFERLRLRLPPIAGARPIAPTVPFGNSAIFVEASRAQEQAQRLPLPVGESVWVGVRRIHALAHPGLHFLIPTDGSPLAQAALELGGQIARLSHARVTLLGYGMPAAILESHLQAAKEKLGSGLASVEVRASGDSLALAVENETERRPYDLVVLGCDPRKNLAPAEAVLHSGDHHLLLVPAPGATPTRALICVAGGEPGKDDVLFAGRLARHLGAEATLFSVIPTEHPANRARAERFLAGGLRSLEGLGVAATASVAVGAIGEAIQQQLTATPHDWLVLGAPLNARTGHVTLDGVVEQILINTNNRPVLIVRSTHVALPLMPLTTGGRIKIVEEVIP